VPEHALSWPRIIYGTSLEAAECQVGDYAADSLRAVPFACRHRLFEMWSQASVPSGACAALGLDVQSVSNDKNAGAQSVLTLAQHSAQGFYGSFRCHRPPPHSAEPRRESAARSETHSPRDWQSRKRSHRIGSEHSVRAWCFCCRQLGIRTSVQSPARTARKYQKIAASEFDSAARFREVSHERVAKCVEDDGRRCRRLVLQRLDEAAPP
jgi:hypothetical protein